MKRREWMIVLLPLFFTWGIDRLTKEWAEHIQGINFHGPLGLVLHHNHGAMLGLFSDLPAVLRVVSLSTGGAFLLFSFMVIQYILPIRSLILRSGMSVLLGGILGNVTDRIIYGYVIDFILLGSPTNSTPAFNMADALQWVGYFMIGWALIRESDILWPTENTRKAYWVNISFQLRYTLILMAIGFGFTIIAGVYSYTFLRVTVIDLIGHNQRMLDHYLIPFILTFLVVSLAFGVILFLTGRILSQKIAGPLYAFERFLDDAIRGVHRPLRLRTGDEFVQLVQLAERISEELKERDRLKATGTQALSQSQSQSQPHSHPHTQSQTESLPHNQSLPGSSRFLDTVTELKPVAADAQAQLQPQPQTALASGEGREQPRGWFKERKK